MVCCELALPIGEWVRLASITLAMSLLAVAGAAMFGLALSFPAANNFLLLGGILDDLCTYEGLTIEQIAWHKSYEFYGGKVFILVKKDRDVYLFHSKDGETLAKGVTPEDFNKYSITKDWNNIENFLSNN